MEVYVDYSVKQSKGCIDVVEIYSIINFTLKFRPKNMSDSGNIAKKT